MRTLDEIVKELGEIELDTGCHAGYPDDDDYENALDFYLESVRSDSYECFVEDNVTEEEINEYGLVEIIRDVEKYIRDNYEVRFLEYTIKETITKSLDGRTKKWLYERFVEYVPTQKDKAFYAKLSNNSFSAMDLIIISKILDIDLNELKNLI